MVGRKNTKPWNRLENVIAEKATFVKTEVSILRSEEVLLAFGSRPASIGSMGPTRTNWFC